MVAQRVGDWLRWSGIPTSGHLRISQATPNGMKAQVGEKGTSLTLLAIALVAVYMGRDAHEARTSM